MDILFKNIVPPEFFVKDIITQDAHTRECILSGLQIVEKQGFCRISGEQGTGKARLAQYYSQTVGRQRLVKVSLSRLAAFLSDLLTTRSVFAQSALPRWFKPEYTYLCDDLAALTHADQFNILAFIRIVASYYQESDSHPLFVFLSTASNTQPLIKELESILSGNTVFLSSLRARPNDIVPLFRHHLLKQVQRFGKSIAGYDSEIETLLLKYEWPGNEREIESVCKILAATGKATIQSQAVFKTLFRGEDTGKT